MGLFDFITVNASITRTPRRDSLTVKPAQNRVQKLFAPKQTVDELVEQIHREFYTASERLMQEAKVLLSQAPQNLMEKGDRLKALGFVNARVSREAEIVKERLVEQEKILKSINDYAIKYPLDKFITEDEVKAICRKYNLVYGEISLYKGDVPDKNLLEIENATKLRPEDEAYQRHSYGGNREMVSRKFFEEHYLSKVTMDGKPIDPNNPANYEEHLAAIKFIDRMGSCHKCSLLICAPESDMKMQGKRVVDSKIEEIPDPIVLERTTNGLLRIITAWGIESQDALVVNTKLN